MQWRVRTTFLIPKAGNQVDECEDAFSIVPTKYSQQQKTLKVSIADGATESSFSKEWAKVLTEKFASLRFPYHIGLSKKLPTLQDFWSKLICQTELPWYAEEKKEMGAFAAFLGVQFNVRKKEYYSIAVGDCCFFQIRNGKLNFSFPYELSDSFSISPYLISSNPTSNEFLAEEIKHFTGSIEDKDTFIFLSDAASMWFLQRCENNEKPWEALMFAVDNSQSEEVAESIDKLIKEQREQKLMKNDDVVIVIIDFFDDAS